MRRPSLGLLNCHNGSQRLLVTADSARQRSNASEDLKNSVRSASLVFEGPCQCSFRHPSLPHDLANWPFRETDRLCPRYDRLAIASNRPTILNAFWIASTFDRSWWGRNAL